MHFQSPREVPSLNGVEFISSGKVSKRTVSGRTAPCYADDTESALHLSVCAARMCTDTLPVRLVKAVYGHGKCVLALEQQQAVDSSRSAAGRGERFLYTYRLADSE